MITQYILQTYLRNVCYSHKFQPLSERQSIKTIWQATTAEVSKSRVKVNY